ncbi:FAD-binding protein [bacterium]|nr:MAG: FAD-binding protein [bacterium]
MLPDPIAQGLASGWQAHDASKLTADARFEGDVAIVGTGAGGGTAAEILARAGLRVVLIEEGPLKSSRDFHMLEEEAYPQLYQESAARKTKDKGINILQGRCVGGSTTVNWTSSFRTPPSTLEYWQRVHGLRELSVEALAPWFERMEQRLNVHPWISEPNRNNSLLRIGAQRLGIPTAVVPRNVKGCWNLGYCDLGCPTNAKQSMLVTTIPAALERGAVLLSRARAERLTLEHGRVREVLCRALDEDGVRPSGRTVTIRARHVVLACGAIGSPALLLRSSAPDPYHLLGRRTFLHPTLVSAAIMPERVDGFAGAPQSIYSDHFLGTQAIDGPVGFKLEVPPLHPVLMASTLTGYGRAHAAMMERLPYAQALIALLRDGFNEGSPGGTVELNGDGSPVLDYPITPYLWEGARRALLRMAEIQFAAGARSVLPLHEDAVAYTSWTQARAAILSLPMETLRARVVSAHVMGGCAMGGDSKHGVVDQAGRHFQLENLAVIDGSVFPTSIGANPQLSIYALAARHATALAHSLAGTA